MTFGRNQLTFCIVFTYFIWKSNAAAGNSRAHIINQDPVIIIKEDTAVGTLVYTLIGDDPENDVMTYSLDATGTELFTLVKTENTKAELRLKKPLNRELTANYEFKAFVTDDVNNADKKTEKALFVTVLDANDNAPIFTEQPYRKSIAENTTVNTNLLTIKAVDADSAANAAVQYRFSNDSSSDIQFKSLWETDKFKIDNVNGHITLTAELDFEKKNRYVLIVIAEDRGSPPQKSETTVVFDVTDINDMPPRFDRYIYSGDVQANSPKGTSVIQVTARDGDIGVNDPVKYNIVQGNHMDSFTINVNSGLITVNGRIDAKNVQLFTLYIMATEVSELAFNTTAKVEISVIEQNGTSPILLQDSYYFKVREDQAIHGHVLMNNIYIIKSEKRVLSYSLTGVDSNKFSIDPKSGILKINSILDYEIQIVYTFKIVVTETKMADKFSENATVLLTLINVNDNTPKFEKPTYDYIFEGNINAGTPISAITAKDSDLGSYGILSYYITGQDAEYFQITSLTGTITAKKTLDYDKKTTYQFRVHARDGGRPDYREGVATVNIMLNLTKPTLGPISPITPTNIGNTDSTSKSAIAFGVLFGIFLVLSLILLSYIIWKHTIENILKKKRNSTNSNNESLYMNQIAFQQEQNFNNLEIPYDDVNIGNHHHHPMAMPPQHSNESLASRQPYPRPTETQRSLGEREPPPEPIANTNGDASQLQKDTPAYHEILENPSGHGRKLRLEPAVETNVGAYQELQEVVHDYQSLARPSVA